MDAKEVKTALKNARDAIRNKEFKEALKQCKAVLAHDKNNYNALVFVGVAAEGLEQPDQALKAYQRAIESSPDQLLAWQGLGGFYEKNPTAENDADLVSVYEKLISFYEKDQEKKLETLRKLVALLGKLGNVDQAVDCFQQLLSLDTGNCKRMESLLQLASLLQKQKTLSPSNEDLLVKTYSEALSLPDLPMEGVDDMVEHYLQLVAKRMNSDDLMKECSQLHSQFPKTSSTLETWLLIMLDLSIGSEKWESTDKFEELLQKLKLLDNKSGSGVLELAEGYQALCGRNFVQAKKLFQEGVSLRQDAVCGYFYLACALFSLHSSSACVQNCSKGLSVLQKKDRFLTVPSSGVSTLLTLTKAKSLCRTGTSQSLAQAEEVLSQENLFEGMQEEANLCLGYVFLKQGEIEKAEACLSSLANDSGEKKALAGWIHFHKQGYQEALKCLQEAADLDVSSSENLYMMGRVLWELKNCPEVDKPHEQCFTTFLKAAKLDPYNSDVFLYLGHFYADIQKDNMKAKKCYQKAFDLDPGSDEAGAALCDKMVLVGEEGDALKLLLAATSQASAGRAKWAWMRLGLHQVKHDDPSTAVSSFQSALRADPKDNHVWECLAEAYLHRGSFTAALKAFTKASELDPDSLYSLYQIASIKQTLGEYAEAVVEYKLILEKSGNYVPALKGLGETYLLLGRHHLTQYLNGLARDDCQQAIFYLTRAATQRPDLSCLWKLLGDGCTILHPLAAETFSIQVPTKLAMAACKDSQEMSYLGKLELLQVGSRCYGRALKNLPDSASLWHDLGINYFHQSELASEDAVESLSEKAVQTLKKSLTLEPNNCHHWNALGVVACSKSYNKPELAQHCFIKSIEVENNNAVAWTNLGSLYLQNDNVQLAHEAFKVAQSLDPNYVACWIGQALIAEIVGHDDAMDLFRHTTELGNHLEGAIGYANWVCSILQDSSKQNTDIFRYCIHQMAAIPAASDALARYTDWVKTNSAAYNMYGLLLEHQNLLSDSIKSFQRALELVVKDATKSDENLKVRLNLGRVLCKAGRYLESVDVFQTVDSVEMCEDLCYFGLAYYKEGKMKESFQVYEQALAKAVTDADKSNVHSALGMVAYKFGDLDGARTALFNGSQLTSPSIIGLQALFSLGLIQSDATLAAAVMQELLKVGGTKDCLSDVTWLSAALNILQGKVSSAKSYIQKVIHKHPWSSALWGILASVLIRFCPDNGQAAASCAKASQKLDRSADQKIPTMISLGQLQGGLHHRRNVSNNALSSAQKAVHLYPDKISSLCTLVSAVHSKAVIQQATTGETCLIQTEQQYLNHLLNCVKDVNPSIQLWCWKQKIVSLVLGGNHEEASRALQKLKLLPLSGEDDVRSFTDVLQSAISGDVAQVKDVIGKQGKDLYLWQILVQLYINNGLIEEADSAIRQCLTSAQSQSGIQVQLVSLLKLASLVYQQIMAGKGDRNHLKSLFDEAISEILKLNPGCSAVWLMQGALSLQKNTRLARQSYQAALDFGQTSSNLEIDLSLARQELIKICHSSKKDEELIQNLLLDAEESADTDTLQLYKKITNKENPEQ